MTQVQAGSKSSYNTLLNELSPFLYNFLNKRISYIQATDDILQEVLINLHKARHTYQPDKSFRAWVLAITRNKMIDVIRKKTRKEQIFSNQGELIDIHGADEKNINAKNSSDDLQKIIKNLPQKNQKILILAKVEGYSITEIAKKHNMSPNAIKQNIYRSLVQLKNEVVSQESYQ